jgi:hypothetical protein
MKNTLFILLALISISCKKDFQIVTEKTEVNLEKNENNEVTSSKTKTYLTLINKTSEVVEGMTISGSISILFKNGFKKHIPLSNLLVYEKKPDSLIKINYPLEFANLDFFKHDIDDAKMILKIHAYNSIGFNSNSEIEINSFNDSFNDIIEFNKNKKFNSFEDVFNNYSNLLSTYQKEYNFRNHLKDVVNILSENNQEKFNVFFKRYSKNHFEYWYSLEEIAREKEREKEREKKYNGTTDWICIEIDNNNIDYRNQFIKITNEYLKNLKTSNTVVSKEFEIHFNKFNSNYQKSLSLYVVLLKKLNKNYDSTYKNSEFLSFKNIALNIIKYRNESTIEYAKAIIQLGKDNNDELMVKEHSKALKELNSNITNIYNDKK